MRRSLPFTVHRLPFTVYAVSNKGSSTEFPNSLQEIVQHPLPHEHLDRLRRACGVHSPETGSLQLTVKVGLQEDPVVHVDERRQTLGKLSGDCICAGSTDGDRGIQMENAVLEIPDVPDHDGSPIGMAVPAAVDLRLERVGGRAITLFRRQRRACHQHDGFVGINELHWGRGRVESGLACVTTGTGGGERSSGGGGVAWLRWNSCSSCFRRRISLIAFLKSSRVWDRFAA